MDRPSRPPTSSRQPAGRPAGQSTQNRTPSGAPRKKLTPQQAARKRALMLQRKRRAMLIRYGIPAAAVLLVIIAIAGIVHAIRSRPEPQSISAGGLTEMVMPEDTTATLAVVGDIMSHMPVTTAAYDSAADSYDYTDFFQYSGTWLSDADFTIGNFESTMAGGDPSGYPLFNSPDDYADSLSALGFDMVTTANNHCLDQGFDGLVRTLDVLDDAGIAHVGTYRTQAEYDENMGVTVANVGDISVAFLDYTYGTNYITVRNDYSVNLFNVDYESDNPSELDTEKLDAELAYAESLNTDLVIVCIHWGIEYQTTENAYQDEVADYLIAHGADAVLGGHAHVPQPMQYRSVIGEDGEQRTGFVCFSLGNFLSNQTDQYTNITAILNLELTKDGVTGETTISDVTYVPMYLVNREGATPRYLLMDAVAGVADYQSRGTASYVSESVYNALLTCQSDLKSIFGSAWMYSSQAEN